MGSQVLRCVISPDLSADMGRKISNKSPDESKVDTEALIHLCQKQVNYWHTAHTVLSDERIEAVKKIAKLAILNRNRGIKEFVNILHKGRMLTAVFDPRKIVRYRNDVLNGSIHVSSSPGFSNTWTTSYPP